MPSCFVSNESRITHLHAEVKICLIMARGPFMMLDTHVGHNRHTDVRLGGRAGEAVGQHSETREV